MKKRKNEERKETSNVRKDPDMTRTHKEKELDEKFITDNSKKKKLVAETNSREYKNSGTSVQQLKSPLQLSYAEVAKRKSIFQCNFSAY